MAAAVVIWRPPPLVRSGASLCTVSSGGTVDAGATAPRSSATSVTSRCRRPRNSKGIASIADRPVRWNAGWSPPAGPSTSRPPRSVSPVNHRADGRAPPSTSSLRAAAAGASGGQHVVDEGDAQPGQVDALGGDLENRRAVRRLLAAHRRQQFTARADRHSPVPSLVAGGAKRGRNAGMILTSGRIPRRCRPMRGDDGEPRRSARRRESQQKKTPGFRGKSGTSRVSSDQFGDLGVDRRAGHMFPHFPAASGPLFQPAPQRAGPASTACISVGCQQGALLTVERQRVGTSAHSTGALAATPGLRQGSTVTAGALMMPSI